MNYIKGVVHLKMNILSSLTHPFNIYIYIYNFLDILWLVKRWDI